MTAHLHPYASYKPSSVLWLGNVPGHWETPRLKPESTEGGRRVSVLRRQEGAPVLLG